MLHDKVTCINYTGTAPMYHAIVIDEHTFILPRYFYWNRQRRFFTIDHNYYSQYVSKRTYVTGGPSSGIDDVIRTYELMCRDISDNNAFIAMSHLQIRKGKQNPLSISHSIFIKHNILPIHRVTISKSIKSKNSYDVRYRTIMTNRVGYTRRCDMSTEGLVEAIHHLIVRATREEDPDVNKNISIQDFIKNYPLHQPLRYCGYKIHGISKINGISVTRLSDSQTYKIIYTLNNVKYTIECPDNRQSIIDELVDIVGIYQIQATEIYSKNRSMISFYHKYGEI